MILRSSSPKLGTYRIDFGDPYGHAKLCFNCFFPFSEVKGRFASAVDFFE
jgi:hypothetical protein